MINKRKFYINGQWQNPKNQNDFEVIDPSNENSYAVISLGGKEDVETAVKAAKNAFLDWSQSSKEFRIDILEKLLKIYKSRWDDLTDTMSKEMGAPIDWCSSAQTSSGYEHIKDFWQ